MTKFESCFRIINALLEDEPSDRINKPVHMSVSYTWTGEFEDNNLLGNVKMGFMAHAIDSNGEIVSVRGSKLRPNVPVGYESPEAAIDAYYEYLVSILNDKREKLAKSLETTGKIIDEFAAGAMSA